MYQELLKNINSKAKEFGNNIVRIKTLNDNVINRSDKLLFEIENLLKSVESKNEKLCTICYSHPRTFVAIPCGHVVCKICSSKMKETHARGVTTRCFICRTICTDIIRCYC